MTTATRREQFNAQIATCRAHPDLKDLDVLDIFTYDNDAPKDPQYKALYDNRWSVHLQCTLCKKDSWPPSTAYMQPPVIKYDSAAKDGCFVEASLFFCEHCRATMYRPILAIAAVLGLELNALPRDGMRSLVQKADVAAFKAYAPWMAVGAVALPALLHYVMSPRPPGTPGWLVGLSTAVWAINGALFAHDIRKRIKPCIYEGVLVHHVK